MSVSSNPRRRILRRALSLFFDRGYSKVTTQDIADNAGISKKTLYQYFPSKKEILMAALSSNLQGIGSRIDELMERQDLDFSEKFSGMLGIVNIQVSSIGPYFREDLSRSLPDAWAMIDEFRNKRVLQKLYQLLEEGQSEGFVRKNLKVDVVVFIMYGFIQQGVTPSRLLSTRISMQEVFSEMIRLLYGGILTQQGMETLSQQDAAFEPEEMYGKTDLFID